MPSVVLHESEIFSPSSQDVIVTSYHVVVSKHSALLIDLIDTQAGRRHGSLANKQYTTSVFPCLHAYRSLIHLNLPLLLLRSRVPYRKAYRIWM